MLTTFNEFDSFLEITPEATPNCTAALHLLTAQLAICHPIVFIFALDQLWEPN